MWSLHMKLMGHVDSGLMCCDAMWSKSDTFLRKVGKHLQDHTASKPRSPQSTFLLP
jgi:hypothetical protein